MIKDLKCKLIKNIKQILPNRQNVLKKLLEEKNQELENLKPIYYWYKWYYSEYAATLRMLQYNQSTLDIPVIIEFA